MNFDNSKDDNILSGQESIFEDSEVSALRNSNKYLDETKNLEDFQDNSIISKFFNALSNALNEDEATKDRKKLQKYADKVFKDNENFIKLLYDFGCVPKKGRQLEIDEAGAINMYNISKADCEDGEIILELEMLEE